MQAKLQRKSIENKKLLQLGTPPPAQSSSSPINPEQALLGTINPKRPPEPRLNTTQPDFSSLGPTAQLLFNKVIAAGNPFTPPSDPLDQPIRIKEDTAVIELQLTLDLMTNVHRKVPSLASTLAVSELSWESIAVQDDSIVHDIETRIRRYAYHEYYLGRARELFEHGPCGKLAGGFSEWKAQANKSFTAWHAIVDKLSEEHATRTLNILKSKSKPNLDRAMASAKSQINQRENARDLARQKEFIERASNVQQKKQLELLTNLHRLRYTRETRQGLNADNASIDRRERILQQCREKLAIAVWVSRHPEDAGKSSDEIAQSIEIEKTEQLEQKRAAVEAELLADEAREKSANKPRNEPKKANAKKGKKPSSNKSNTKPVESKSKDENINAQAPHPTAQTQRPPTSHIRIRIDERVTRWKTCTLDQARAFWDTSGTQPNLSRIQRYRNLDDQQLVDQITRHNLGCVAEIMRSKQQLASYATPYHYVRRDGSVGTGQAFMASLGPAGESSEMGIIHSALGQDGCLFHVGFIPLAELERYPLRYQVPDEFEAKLSQPAAQPEQMKQPKGSLTEKWSVAGMAQFTQTPTGELFTRITNPARPEVPDMLLTIHPNTS